MRLRHKQTGQEYFTDQFNTHALAEVNVGDDSVYIKDLDVFLPDQDLWKDLRQAFADRDLITDNYQTRFFPPKDEEERKRGYRL